LINLIFIFILNNLYNMARKRHSRRHRGGAGAPNPSSYSSAASYGLAVNGGGDAQWDRTFIGNGPANYTGVQGQKAGAKRSRRTRGKRGGFWGEIINQAVVPLSILGMQQTYKKKHRGGKHTRRRRH
jgi:hypothetical protein